MKDYMINHLRVAMGTASYCKTCKALMLGGVNNPEVAKSLGIKSPRAWYQFLKDHEEYHKAKGEEIPSLWTVAGLSDEMKARCLGQSPKPQPRVSDAELARRAFVRAAATPKRLMNHRQDNRPVVKPLDTTPFAGF